MSKAVSAVLSLCRPQQAWQNGPGQVNVCLALFLSSRDTKGWGGGAPTREHGSLGLAHKGMLLSLLQRSEPPGIAFTSWPLTAAAHIKGSY